MSAHRLVSYVVHATVAASCGLLLVGCACPPPMQVEQTFVLDATWGVPLDFADTGLAPTPDGSDEDATSSLAPPSEGPPSDCSATAAGCTPGGACPAACTCVLARALVTDGTVESCTLLKEPGPLQVRVRYSVPAVCGD
jgi:hypothetical protein